MFRIKEETFYLATTRFNKDTILENERYRNKYDFDGCIYGVPQPIASHIPRATKVIVFEMVNCGKKDKEYPGYISGVGIIVNHMKYVKHHHIYSDQNYNRYSYIGSVRLDREEMTEDQLNNLEFIENMVFRGKGHLKRGQGITCIPSKKIDLNRKKLLEVLISLFT